jgi:hypothetical protein
MDPGTGRGRPLSHDELVEALVDDLRPTRAVAGPLRALSGWTLLAWVIVSACILASGPLRDGAIATLLASPRYALEFAFGVLASLSAVAAGFELGVPGDTRGSPRLVVFGVMFTAWLSLLAYGVFDPAIAPSPLGKRPQCVFETFAFSLAPTLLALRVLARRALFHRVRSGALVGLGAAAIPALWMQLACLYDPVHALTAHVAPIALVAALSASLADRMLPKP